MARNAFPVVKGKALRFTKVGNCGLPIEGEANSIVTDGFITVQLTKVTADAEDLEQKNANGNVCVADRTAPELKWFEVTLTLCNVDPELLPFLTNDPVVLDYLDNPVGFRSAKSVRIDTGAAMEVWSGVGGSDCVEPTDDSIFESAAATGGASYGYFLTPWLKEGTIGDIEIGASVMNLTITAITGNPAAWGRGPYDVVEVEAGVAGRLLTPMGADNHLHVQKTPIAPPQPTDGATSLELPSPYFATSP